MSLAVMQQFDPPGVFARDMRECLMLQLIDRNRYDRRRWRNCSTT